VPRDIFGWTPIHYSCLFNEGGMELSTYRLWWDDILENRQAVKLHKQLDRFRRSPVHIAASNGLGGVLEHMFSKFITDQNEAGFAVNAAGADGMTPIHWAAQSGEPQALKALTKSALQVSTTATDIWGREPLHISARQGREDVVNLILKAGRWSLSTDTLGKNPVDYVLTQPSTRDQAKDPTSNENGGNNSDGSTADTNSNEKARRLIQDPQRLQILERFATERPAWKDQSGRSFLHYAVEATELATVQKLVESQTCNPAAEDSDGRTALHVALENNNVPASLYLLGLPDENLREIGQAKASLLIDACKGGCTAAIPRILELWPEADAVNKGDAQYDQSALSWAIETGNNDAAELLVNHPLTDLNKPATRHYDLTPLRFAALHENTEGMKLLLRQPLERIDIRQKANDGRTPLGTAIWFEKPKITRLLLLHPETPATDRERHLEEILRYPDTFSGLVADLFKHMAAHDSLSAEGLSDVIEGSTYLRVPEHFEKFVPILLRGNALDLAKGLYLPAVRASSARAISELLSKGVDSTSIDEDGWSLEYYVKRFDRMELLEGLGDGLLQSQEETTYPAPRKLLRDERHDCISGLLHQSGPQGLH
jgi:ankyrin repeat protein